MKEILFMILVVLLTPVYITIIFLKNAGELCIDFFQPVRDGINLLLQDMLKFWKKLGGTYE